MIGIFWIVAAVVGFGSPQQSPSANNYALIKMKAPDVSFIRDLGDCGFRAMNVADAYEKVGGEGRARYAAMLSVRVAASRPLSNEDAALLYRGARFEAHFNNDTGELTTMASQLGADRQHTQGVPMIFFSDAPVTSIRCSSVSDN